MNKNTDNEIFYFTKNIALIRNKNKLSKTKMAKLLGISTKTLNKLENGVIPPRIGVNVIFNIQDNFGIPAKLLFKDME